MTVATPATDAAVRRVLAQAPGVIGRPLSDEEISRLTAHFQLVAAWSARARLTAITRPAEAAKLHILDSLLCLRAGIPDRASVVDVGSGAGFPGIPLAIVRPDLSVVLLEPAARKAAFLEMAAAALHLAVRVEAVRAEDAGRDPRRRERFDVGVARAVAPLPVLCELILPLVRVGGKAVLLKGPSVRTELPQGRAAARRLGGDGEPQVIEALLPGGVRRSLVVIGKVAATPAAYPRRAGVPARHPLGA